MISIIYFRDFVEPAIVFLHIHGINLYRNIMTINWGRKMWVLRLQQVREVRTGCSAACDSAATSTTDQWLNASWRRRHGDQEAAPECVYGDTTLGSV